MKKLIKETFDFVSQSLVTSLFTFPAVIMLVAFGTLYARLLWFIITFLWSFSM
jgi:hypothetical protein